MRMSASVLSNSENRRAHVCTQTYEYTWDVSYTHAPTDELDAAFVNNRRQGSGAARWCSAARRRVRGAGPPPAAAGGWGRASANVGLPTARGAQSPAWTAGTWPAPALGVGSLPVVLVSVPFFSAPVAWT